MVDYSGSNAIELEDDVFEEVNNFTPMPQYIPGLPEKPDLIDPKPEDYFNDIEPNDSGGLLIAEKIAQHLKE